MTGKYNSLGIVQGIEISPWYQMVHEQTRVSPREWDTKNTQGFAI